MRNAAILVGLIIILTGCTSPVTDQTATSTTTTIDPKCATTPDYDRKPLPELPEDVTRATATKFAKTHAETLVWNDAYGAADTELGVNAEASMVNQTDDGYLVFVTGGVSYSICERGSRAVSDGAFWATYFINETTALRLPFPKNKTDDPREHNGEVVAQTAALDLA